jgi:kynurenine formamidase
MRVIDLSFLLDEFVREPVVAWVPGVNLTPTATYKGLGRSVHQVTMGTHGAGTHIDPPAHFFEEGATIDQVPFDKLIGEAILLDLTSKGPGDVISAHDLDLIGADVEAGDIVLLHTGWYHRWGTSDYFWRAPYLAIDAAKWLVEREIATLGYDIPSPDNMHDIKPNSRPPIHIELLGNNILLIEMLTNLGLIDQRRFDFIALPLKFEGGDGSPARAVALLQ